MTIGIAAQINFFTSASIATREMTRISKAIQDAHVHVVPFKYILAGLVRAPNLITIDESLSMVHRVNGTTNN